MNNSYHLKDNSTSERSKRPMSKRSAKQNRRKSRLASLSILTPLALCLVVFADRGSVQAQGTTQSPPRDLKRLSVEELMDLEVTSVSRRPEKLSETASAIQVITQEDIRRSGVTSLPEALRLASNLEVAQVDSRQWAISARGFNSTTA